MKNKELFLFCNTSGYFLKLEFNDTFKVPPKPNGYDYLYNNIEVLTERLFKDGLRGYELKDLCHYIVMAQKYANVPTKKDIQKDVFEFVGSCNFHIYFAREIENTLY